MLLITGLWTMTVFSVMTASLGFGAFEEIALIKRDLEDFRTRQDYAAVLSRVAAKIEEDPEPHEDSAEDEWIGNVELDASLAKTMNVTVEDEESKLNLNTVPEALLAAFLKLFEDEIGPLKGSRKSYVREISKRRSKKRIESLEELLLLEDFAAEDLEALRPYVSVYPESPSLNVNTAKLPVLRALMAYLSSDAWTRVIFLAHLEEARALPLRSDELRPGLMMARLKLPQTPAMLMLVQDFLAHVGTDSETFHLTMKKKGGYGRGFGNLPFSGRAGAPLCFGLA